MSCALLLLYAEAHAVDSITETSSQIWAFTHCCSGVSLWFAIWLSDSFVLVICCHVWHFGDVDFGLRCGHPYLTSPYSPVLFHYRRSSTQNEEMVINEGQFSSKMFDDTECVCFSGWLRRKMTHSSQSHCSVTVSCIIIRLLISSVIRPDAEHVDRAWAQLLYMLLVIYYVLFQHILRYSLYTMSSMDLAKPLINVEVIFILPWNTGQLELL